MFNKIKSLLFGIEKKATFSISIKSLKELKYFNGAKEISDILQKQNKKSKLMLVGGCVRKLLSQEEINDVDIATNLNPQEVKNILNQNKMKVLDTGISHGTVTAVINNLKYEITTLRKDVTTDGRYADVEFISDWEVDSKRRDFTINAIYSNLQGEIYDPQGGLNDLQKGLVKFIGDPDKRIKEDYLRILRYLRFYTQYGKHDHEIETTRAIKRNLTGILIISKERILGELLKILDLKNFDKLFKNQFTCFVILSMFPQFKYHDRLKNLDKVSQKIRNKLDKALVLSILLVDNLDNSDFFLYKYNLSKKIKKRILFIQENFRKKIFNESIDKKTILKMNYLNGIQATTDLLIFSTFVEKNLNIKSLEKKIDFLEKNETPKFPIDANYLKLYYGFSESKELGIALEKLKKHWTENNFQINKEKIKIILKLK